jgi:MurNAc alpha-1-phosphate uridylyltransferase
MRPLTNTTPKPLLTAGGKPLLAWQIEALARGGFKRIVVNVAHLAEQFVAAFGDGSAFGVELLWSFEREPLEAAGGIVTALPLLPEGPVLIVSGDIHSAFRLRIVALARRSDGRGCNRTARSSRDGRESRLSPMGDFALIDGRIDTNGATRKTFGNIGLYDTALFTGAPPATRLKLLPYFERWIAARLVSGEHFEGRWMNVGTPDDLAALDRTLGLCASPAHA